MTIQVLETPAGPGRLSLDVPATPPRAVLLLGHGAGGGVEAFDLAALAAALPDEGIVVVRFEQPWRTAGRRVATPPAMSTPISARDATDSGFGPSPSAGCVPAEWISTWGKLKNNDSTATPHASSNRARAVCWVSADRPAG